MSDETTRLDEIAERLEAATPVPWQAYGTTVAAMTGPGDCGGCSGLPSPAHEPACLWSEIAGADEPDAELIAHAPADLSSLLAVVREVAARHHRTAASEDPAWQYVTGLRDAYCAHCLADWPCPDARALEALTETTEGEEK